MQKIDNYKIDRAATNVAKLLADLLKQSVDFEKRSRKLRLRISVDLKSLVKSTPAENRGCLLSMIAFRIQEIFNAGGSPKVELSGGCAGSQGVGVRATEGGAYAGVCVTGSLSKGVTGGGVEAGFRY